jgi:hypothetical protein
LPPDQARPHARPGGFCHPGGFLGTYPAREWTRARQFGRLKKEWAMLPPHVQRIYRSGCTWHLPVRLHVDLIILAQLASALLRART